MSNKKTFGRIIHPVAGGLAMILIVVFILSTIIVEIIGDPAKIAALKYMILYGICLLLPASMVAGVSGFRMVKAIPPTGILAKKAKRMKVIGVNGVFVLVPCAIGLEYLAAQGDFGPVFMVVQAIELTAGPVNLVLMGLNMRDGLAMTRGRRTQEW